MQKDSFNSTTTTLPSNSLPNKKPIFVTIQKSGNNIILAKPKLITAPPSQIPKLYVSSSHIKLGKSNGSHLKVLLQQLQHGPNKTYPPVNINFIHNRKKSIKHSIEASNVNCSLKMQGIAPNFKTKPVEKKF
ncbi:uncharacterized protein LOC119084710 [Bradysia coprophila]|uniref:uncharacterized protein LOC119084710 n=1 Tax=Bradysia coprophila TaxID=38358 RepID=UPI00187DBE97|nr:uncharacterized protein LOC119084710 [Bradysia coprophila]